MKVAPLLTKTLEATTAAGLDSAIATFVQGLTSGNEQLVSIHHSSAYNGTAIIYTAMIVYST